MNPGGLGSLSTLKQTIFYWGCEVNRAINVTLLMHECVLRGRSPLDRASCRVFGLRLTQCMVNYGATDTVCMAAPTERP